MSTTREREEVSVTHRRCCCCRVDDVVVVVVVVSLSPLGYPDTRVMLQFLSSHMSFSSSP